MIFFNGNRFYLYAMSQMSVGEAIKEFLKKSRLKTGIQALQIEEIWEKMMGKTIAKYTDKIQIINQTLFIRTNVGPLKQELIYQKEKIIERVNEALGEKVIKEVVIQ
jgi:hypothetical protein